MGIPYVLHHLLEAAAHRNPDGLAVIDGDRSVTYGELEGRANQLAHLLLEIGVARGDRVGLYLEKSIESIVGIYGILKTGAAYVPQDPKAPVARIGYIADNCGLRCMLTGLERREQWSALLAAGAPTDDLVVMNSPDVPAEHAPAGVRCHASGAIDAQPNVPPAVGAIDLDLAYILYTSGSTGDPKGVMLTHRNALAFVDWAVEEFAVERSDRLSSHAPLHFDLSVFDLFAAASASAPVVLVPASVSSFPVEVARFIDRHQITIWYSVPSILSMMTLRGGLQLGDLRSLRTVLFAGEVFPTAYLRQLMTLVPHARFANLYGPTETNVCTWYEVPVLAEADTASIPIGRAIANVDVFAVTDDGRVAQPGETGLLYVRGATVMRGYWGDPECTARGLGPHPLGYEQSDPVYCTGDLVQASEDGNFRFLGRRDAQIKSRGYRIELGEIEAALYAHPDVVECAGVAVPDDLFTNRIKVFVVARRPTESAELARFCADRLPRYMIPELWEFLDALPKTSTGKVDRQALA